MKIIPVTDPSFRKYGQILTGYDTQELLKVLDEVSPLPETGTVYCPEKEELMALPIAKELQDRAFGGMKVELGYCNGRNTMLNALEYHRDSELNLGTTDFILLLGKREEIGEDGLFDTANVAAYLCPAGTLIEVYATTLHFAPCSAKKGQGFKVLVVLPQGTNTEKPEIEIKNNEDRTLRARNKWLLAHPDFAAGKPGIAVGLKGINIDISQDI